MKTLVKKLLRSTGIQITRLPPSNHERVVTLHPDRPPQGTVLLSWLLEPFLLMPGEPIPNSHTQYWECAQIARTFLDLGFAVDVIDSHNETFQPTKPYVCFVGHRINFDRLARLLKEGCVKIAYLDTAHWVFNNSASYRRKLELQRRKGFTIRRSHRLIEPNLAVEQADYAVLYGNEFTLSTYRHANKPFFCVPITTCALFPWSEQKNYDACRTNFLWFGSMGFIHKGLDLVLEAFMGMPECQLYVCGPFDQEKEFVQAFAKELYQTPNIHAIGWVDVNGPQFLEVVNKCAGIVYPSCSEGQAGSVITSMHAGLVPLVSYESGIDVDGCGVVFEDHSVQTIQETVRMVSRLQADGLQQMAQKAWEYARARHTRENYAGEFQKTILTILKLHSGDPSPYTRPGLTSSPLRPVA